MNANKTNQNFWIAVVKVKNSIIGLHLTRAA